MPAPASYRPRPGDIPTDPGVYRFRDKEGRVIYVGKAKSLRARLSSYFQDTAALHPRTAAMVTTGASVEWTVVANEVEALQLEYSWIKEFDPRFNVKYRDDKSYPYLAVTMGEEFPRAQVMRGAKRRSTRYFGPYAHAWAIRETLDTLLRVFPLRTCSNGVFRRAGQVGRPCLLGYIDKCSAPCVGRVSEEEHRAIAQDFCDFMAGDTGKFVKRLEKRMKAAAAELDFEAAARLRDDIGALEKALEHSAVVFNDATDADVFGLAGDELEAAVQVFHVRGGRIRGQRGWVLERQDEDDAQLVGHLLAQVYGPRAAGDVPREVLVPVLPADADALGPWLGELAGRRVDLRVPQRGDKRALLQTVERNATQSLARHKVSRAGDLTNRGRALEELREALELPEAPLRIECYDVSHVQGTDVVASMVVFEDGLPRKSEYRRFAIKGPGVDDTAAMREVLTRRFRQQRAQPDETAQTEVTPGIDPETGRPRRFAYAPQLVVVDGGLPQVNAAQAALAEVGATDVAVVGLAKRLEELWLPGEEFPVVLPRTSEGLFLLQRLRDEAHRFAITYHRQKRSKSMTASALDAIPGLGDARRRALLKSFRTVSAIRRADPQELQAVPGIGPALAASIHEALAEQPSGGAVNVMTGEVTD
ncbi:excinuclease ABC subunit C [Kineosphaera limosa]|uniref:UvrABC system protein C n=1 Tax=Kineosphaera limosa NBRC 100340 TaxID=1184609 RepID=K6W5L1_9MICO|nr:excinuclease ABC subunit UvrC [Kineosphaera limosa]NYE03123.1 excinuclease ABC subunit C [Kineosphaera limosa]GAB94460.1 UvrABC system protein C [Kineosphaera limosa NBRC 100340]